MRSFNLKRPSLACRILILAVIIVCSSIALAEPSGWAIKQLTNNDFEDYNPALSDSSVVWVQEDFNGVRSLLFYNGSTTIKLSENFEEESFKLSGANIAWYEYDDANERKPLLFYNGSTITKLSESRDIYDFDISGSNVIWEEYNDVDALFFFNGSTITKISDELYIFDFGISGSNAVWKGEDDFNETLPLFFYNGSTITKLTDHLEDGFFKISDSNVTWIDYNHVDYTTSLFFYNGSSITKLADDIDVYNVEQSLKISGSNAAWAEYNDVDEVYSLFFYDGSTVNKLATNIVQFSDEEGFQISGSNAAWAVWDDFNDATPLFLYNGSTITKLADDIITSSIQISDSTIIWLEWEWDDAVIEWVGSLFAYNGSTVTKLVNNIDEYSFKISGSIVAWKDWDDINEVTSLFIYNGSTITKLTTIEDEDNYYISGSNVLWQHSDGTDYEIFLATQITAVGLQVILGPAEAVLAGAQWSVDDGEWHNSGDVISGLSAGQHEVEYSPATGWWAPLSETVTINDGMLTSIRRNYTPQTGGIQITLGPADALSSGAQWNVDGGDWQNSGAIVANLTVGSHTVNYKSINDWIAPVSESVTVDCSLTTSISRNYIQQTGSIQITLGPADALSAGAQWNVDGGDWQNSTSAVIGLPIGSHTVNYNSPIP